MNAPKKVTDNLKAVNEKLKFHKCHMSAEQIRVMRKRKKRLKYVVDKIKTYKPKTELQ
jgi:hypothetical protein